MQHLSGDNPEEKVYVPLPGVEQAEERAALLPSDNRLSTEDSANPTGCTTPNGDDPAATTDEENSVVVAAATRWRDTAAKALFVKRFHDAIDEAIERHAPGAAPGVDPRRSKYQHLAAKWCLPVNITVVDYDAKDVTVHPVLTCAEQLEELLGRPRGGRVRWIHVDGLNWDVIQVLALRYDLHPLALEDTVHVPQRVKADFYDSCLYVSLIYLYLAHGAHPHTGNDSEGDDRAPRPGPQTQPVTGSGPLPGRTAGSRTAAAASRTAAAASRTASGRLGAPAAATAPPPTARTLSSAVRGGAAELDVEVVAEAEYAGGLAARARSRLTVVGREVAAGGGVTVDGGGGGGGGGAARDQRQPRVSGGGGGGVVGGAGSGLTASAASGPSHYPLPLRRGSVTLHSEAYPDAAPPAPPAAPSSFARGASSRRHNDAAAAAAAGASDSAFNRVFSFFGRRGSGGRAGGAAAAGSSIGGGGGGGGSSRWGARTDRAIHVSAQQVSLFLLRGEHPNTLLTVFQSDGSAVVEPILDQLREPRTLVREAEDASFLANLVIDTLVDHIFPVVGAYREQLQQYEEELGLPRGRPTRGSVGAGGGTQLPSAASIGELHAMQRDLRRLDRTLAPLQVVVSNIISRDRSGDQLSAPAPPLHPHLPHVPPAIPFATATAASAFAATPTSSLTPAASSSSLHPIPTNPGPTHPSSSSLPSRLAAPGTSPPPPPPVLPPPGPPAPFLSRLARTYLGDVRDHVSTLCEDLMSLSAECGDLIGLIFNLTALRQSQSTQTLSVVSTIFLPITFLAGVYGMNFQTLPELHWAYGYVYFWATCAAIVVVFTVVLMRAGMLS